MSMMTTDNTRLLEEYLATIQREFDEIRKFSVGDSGDIARLMMCRLSVGPRMPKSGKSGESNGLLRGSCVHAVMDDVPGTGKTHKAMIFAALTGGKFSRIQFTKDLTPTKILGGYRIIDGKWVLEYGPIFAHIVLADEINRASEFTQSALLEAMGEGAVTYTKPTAFDEDQKKNTISLPRPFWMLATQNPIEQEGVQALPEAQEDRFGMLLIMPRYTLDDIVEIARRNEEFEKFGIEPVSTIEDLESRRKFIQENVSISKEMRNYIARLVMATHNPESEAGVDERKRSLDLDKAFQENWEYIWKAIRIGRYSLVDLVKQGSSPRGAIFLTNISRSAAFLAHKREKRDIPQVTPKDIKKIAVDVLSHRLWLTDQGKMVAEEFGGKHKMLRRIMEHIIEYVEW